MGAGNVARWVKHWLHQPDNLSSDLQKWLLKARCIIYASVASVNTFREIGGRDLQQFAGWPDWPVQQESRERCCLKAMRRGRTSVHTRWHTHACTHTCTHIPAHAHAHTHAHTHMHTHTEWATISAKSPSVYISGLFGHTVSVSGNWLYHCGHKAIKIINKWVDLA